MIFFLLIHLLIFVLDKWIVHSMKCQIKRKKSQGAVCRCQVLSDQQLETQL